MDELLGTMLIFSPCILWVGALLCWLNTRKLSALIMMLGFMPSILSVTGYWFVSPYLEFENGVPTGVVFDVYKLIAQISAVGSALGMIAFVFFAWSLRSEKNRAATGSSKEIFYLSDRFFNQGGSMRIYFLIIPLILIIGCTSSESPTEVEKKWKGRLESFQPVGKSRQMLASWLMEYNKQMDMLPVKTTAILGMDDFRADAVVMLESVEGDGIVCTDWSVMLSLSFRDDESVEAYKVDILGHCL